MRLIEFKDWNTIFTDQHLRAFISGIDQYIGVIHALQYHRHMTKKRSNASIFLVWTLSLISGVTVTLLSNTQANVALISLVSLLNIIHTVPCLLLMVVYFKIFRAAHSSSERARRNSAVRDVLITLIIKVLMVLITVLTSSYSYISAQLVNTR